MPKVIKKVQPKRPFTKTVRSDKPIYEKNMNRLTKEQERHLLLLSSKGDIKARNKLVEDNLWVLRIFVKKYVLPWWWRGDKQDLYQAGAMGLMKAISKFDLGYDCRLTTLAGYYIRREIFLFAGKEKRQYQDSQDMEEYDIVEEEVEDALHKGLDLEIILCSVDTLDDARLAGIFRLAYQRGLTDQAIGEIYGISKQRVQQLRSTIPDKLSLGKGTTWK